MTVTVGNSTVDGAADDIVAAARAVDYCPLACEEDAQLDIAVEASSTGALDYEILLTRDGEPATGLTLSAEAVAGTLDASATTTDEYGYAYLSVAPDDDPEDVTLTVYADGQSVYRVEPTPDASAYQVLAFLGDACEFEESATYTSVAFGDPRTIGFWKHQTKTALGGKGRNHVSQATLESWLPFTVFDTTYTTLEEVDDALWISDASMDERALQQCTASYLNLAWGEVGWYTDVDLDEDGTGDGYFYELWTEAEDAFDAGDCEDAKTLCDTFNNL